MTTKRTPIHDSLGKPVHVDPERHSRACVICNSPNREAIDDAFLAWTSAAAIHAEFNVSRSSLYRHAQALELFQLRRRNYRAALEQIIERAANLPANGDTVVQAVRTCVRFDDDGNWHDYVNRVVVSRANGAGSTDDTLPASPFLPGTPNQVEIDVTPTKQSAELDPTRTENGDPPMLREPSVIHKSW